MNTRPPQHQICLASVSTKFLIDIREIIRIQSISNYSKLFFSNGKSMVVAKVLVRFEEQLQERDFVRVHRTHLVNRNYISQYLSFNGSDKVELTNGEMIDVSRRKANDLKHRISQVA